MSFDEIDFLSWENPQIPNQTLQERCANDDTWAFYVLKHFKQLKEYFPNLVDSIQERADQQHASAQNNLGQCYIHGMVVDKNPEKAVHYFTLAANQQHAAAQNNLGQCYIHGMGVDKNPEQAVHYFTLAANQGNATAQNTLGYCTIHGIGVDKNLEKVVECFTLAANQGHAKAQHNLGSLYHNGIGVDKNPEQAVHCFTLAANQGHASAQHKMGFCYEKGEGVPKNMATALYWKMVSKKKKNDPFLASHVWYLSLEARADDEKCALKLTTINNNLSISFKHFQQKIEEKEKQLWSLQGTIQSYQSINKAVKGAMDLFDRVSKVLKQGFMVPLIGVSAEVDQDYQRQSSPRKLELYISADLHYLSFGEKAIQCQKDLVQLEKKFEEAEKVMDGLEQNHYGFLISQKERELEDKKTGSSPDQEECKKLAEKIGYFSKILTNVQKDRERLAQHKQEARSFIRLTAKDRQDIWHEEYPVGRQKR